MPNSSRKLREGFTTGSAAAAACTAAALILLGKAPSAKKMRLEVPLPPDFSRALSIQANSRLCAPCPYQACATASVIKDGGDDPDATHGMLILASAALSPDHLHQKYFSGERSGPTLAPPIALGENVTLHPGEGIGRVTLPGLPVTPGEAAINPQPRRQIAATLAKYLPEFFGPSPPGHLHLLLQAPEGEARARRTMNARLGIVGGISILGTRGIVRPYSHEAWMAVIAQSVDQAKALNAPALVFSTGRRSESALRSLIPDLPEKSFVQAADYAAFAVQAAVQSGFKHIIWGLFSGKLLKLAQGLRWTHAKSAPADLNLILDLPEIRNLPERMRRNLSEPPTVQGIFDLLEAHDKTLAQRALRCIAEQAKAALYTWTLEAAQGLPTPAPAPANYKIELYVLRPSGELWLKD